MQKKIERMEDALLMPNERKGGWIEYEENVLFIEVSAETAETKDVTVTYREGYIYSQHGNYGPLYDNVLKTVLWLDKPCREALEGEDENEIHDLHVLGVNITDPRLIRYDELHYLKDEMVAQQWFAGVYDRNQIGTISNFFRHSEHLLRLMCETNRIWVPKFSGSNNPCLQE